MKKESLNPMRLIVESAAIFLSVLLAFFVEEWREEADEHRKATETLTLVQAELAQNLAELERVIPLRGEQVEFYNDAIQVLTDEGRFPRQLPDFESPQITSLAYELATDSGAVTIVDPEALLLVAKAYEALSDVRENDEFLNSRNAQIRFNDGEQYLSGFLYYLGRAMDNEPTAVVQVEAALAVLASRVEKG